MVKDGIPEVLIHSSLSRFIPNVVKPMVQANVITSAKTDLTRDQRRIVYYLLREIYVKNSWPENGVLSIDHRIYATLYAVSEQEARDDLRKAITEFRGKSVCYSDVGDEHGWGAELTDVEIDWTTKRESRHKSGKYRITFNSELKDLLMPLAALNNGLPVIPFTVMDESETKRLKQRYSLRLYESLCQFQRTGRFIVKVDDLRLRWSTPKSYEKFAAFRLYALNKVVEELRSIGRFSGLQMFEHQDDRGRVQTLEFVFDAMRESDN